MVQRAGARRWEARYEPAFYDGSYGFRQGRSPHAARHELRPRGLTAGRGGLVEAAGRGDCARIARTRRGEGLRKRVNAGRMRRRIGTWRRAGVRAQGARTPPETGVVPGGGIAPVLAHVFRHQVREAWCAGEGQPRMQGRCVLMRCADDGGMGCALAGAARTIMAVLPQRFARFGRPMPPTQTALMACRTPEAPQGSDRGTGPGPLLGLPHSWTPARQGAWGMKRRTARKRWRRPKQSLWRWGRTHRHAPLPYQYPRRCAKRRGHWQSDGLRGHVRLLEAGRRGAEKAWRYGVSRRSRTRAMGGKKCGKLLQTSLLPLPGIVHTIGLALQGRTGMRQRRAETLVTEEP